MRTPDRAATGPSDAHSPGAGGPGTGAYRVTVRLPGVLLRGEVRGTGELTRLAGALHRAYGDDLVLVVSALPDGPTPLPSGAGGLLW